LPATAPASRPATADNVAAPLSMQASVAARGFRFVGNTRLSDAELQKVVAPYVGRTLTSEELDRARRALTARYVDAGYINSGAVLPDQTVAGGIVTFRIIEGRLSDVDVTYKDADGKPTQRNWLVPEYVADRIRLAANPPPLDLLRLKDQLELLRQDRNIGQINAELKPGAESGDSRLDVQLRENNPYYVALQWSDRRNPSVGSTAYDLIAADSDLTGRGDSFHVQYDLANGPVNDPRLDGADDFSLDYSIPITPADTTFSINFTRTNALVTQLPFTDLNIASRTDSTSFTLRQPVYRRPVAEVGTADHPGKPSVEFDLFATAALRDNSTYLLGRPFSFSPGEDNGAGRVTVLRFGQELVMRGPSEALSGRSTISLGVPWFGATPNVGSGEAGGKFFAWLGQAQYVRLIGASDWQLVLRTVAQLSDRPLLPVEQFSLGGLDSVRGYPENYLVRDAGITGTAEVHIPLIHGKPGDAPMLALVPFVDGGYGWNRNHASAPSQALDSIGLGLLCNPNRHFSAQVFYGLALKDHALGGRDPEDLGVHFNVLYAPF
jgi:hemolysin activation/secretion protein